MGQLIMRQHILLNNDWFALSVALTGEERKPKSGYKWVEFEGTNVWKRRRILLNEYGEKVLTLLSEPKSSVIRPDAGLMEVANEWLYHGIGVGGTLRLFKYLVEYRELGMSRLDLAMDFVPDEKQQKVIWGLSDSSMYVSGKRSGSGFWSSSSAEWMPEEWRGKRIPHCQSWGHKTTGVKWKLYYKSKELREAGGGWFAKPYIVDQWRESGFDINNVWRLEVSLHNCNGLTVDGQTLSRDFWYKNTNELASSLYSSRFIIREDGGHKDKSNDRRVHFLPVRGDMLVRCKVNESGNTRNARVSLLRSLVRACDDEMVKYDERTVKGVCDHVRQLVQRDGLNRYFQAMVGKSLNEWCFEVISQSSGSSFEVVTKNTDIQTNTGFDTCLPPSS